MIILYDGVCGLCNKVTQFVLPRDKKNRFQFAALQSDYAKALLAKHGKSTDELTTFYLVKDDGRLLDRADGALGVLEALGGIYSLTAIFKIVPRPIRNAVYNFIARRRYGWFGKTDSCVIPRPEHRHKFIG